MATALTPQTDVTSGEANRKQNRLKTKLNNFIILYLIKSETSDSFVNHFDGHFAYLKTLDFYFNEQNYSPALSFREFLVKILKMGNSDELELVKSVSCNPNTVGLYCLENRASSSKLAWKPLMFHCSIASVRENGWQVHLVIGQRRLLVRIK